MANIQIYVSHSVHFFCASCNYFRYTNILKLWPSKIRPRLRSIILAITLFDSNCQNLQKTPKHFCASSYHFRYVKILNVWLSKNSTRPHCAIFTMTSIDGKYQNLHVSKSTCKNHVKIYISQNVSDKFLLQLLPFWDIQI